MGADEEHSNKAKRTDGGQGASRQSNGVDFVPPDQREVFLQALASRRRSINRRAKVSLREHLQPSKYCSVCFGYFNKHLLVVDVSIDLHVEGRLIRNKSPLRGKVLADIAACDIAAANIVTKIEALLLEMHSISSIPLTDGVRNGLMDAWIGDDVATCRMTFRD